MMFTYLIYIVRPNTGDTLNVFNLLNLRPISARIYTLASEQELTSYRSFDLSVLPNKVDFSS